MLKYNRSVLVATIFALLVGCQTPTNETFFTSNLTNNDKTITTAVLEAMLINEDLSNLNVHVETVNGIVSLSGYVKTIRQSDTSEDIARKIPGVKSVQNNIIVRK